jgi:hypothetical protein
MRRSARIGRGCVWALIGLAVLIALVPWQGIIWDGGFDDVECRLKFVDANGNPVPGVTLTVFTRAGVVCHYYPVDEFFPDRPVVSDAEGQMVFHHSSNHLEFAGHESSNLIGMRFGETSAPHYDCVFTLGGREVFRTPFNFHRREWDEFWRPAVQRSWQPPWDTAKHDSPPEKEYEARLMTLFDGKTGDLDREERTAASNFRERFWREPDRREITFLVVERTIAIPIP